MYNRPRRIIETRRRKEQHTPIYIRETEVERMKTFKFLEIYISEDVSWFNNTQHFQKKSQQRLHFLGMLRKFGMATEILSNCYTVAQLKV